MKRLLLISALALAPLLAHADGLIAGVAYAERANTKGAEVELGYRKTFTNIGLNLIPLSGILYSKPDPRYRQETFSNGSTVCRDLSNGQFSDKDNCSKSGFDYGFIASLDYAVTPSIFLGGGVRVGKRTDAFATVRAQLNTSLTLQAKAGGDYLSIGASWGF